jgi:hypothetical protein
MPTTRLIPAENLQNQPPAGRTVATASPLATHVWNDTVGGSIDTVRKEIDDAFDDMKTFYQLEPDEIMRMCGGHSARLSEIRVRIQRTEDWNREWRAVRMNEIEPALDELERQYTIASRLHSVRELDYKMETGER